MSRSLFIHIIRFLALYIIQVLIFKRIAFNWGDFAFVHFLIYPMFIILLPINLNKSLVILIAFLMGLSIDVFYDSLGIHAAASTIAGYSRAFIFKFLEPYEGYNIDDKPTISNMGLSWFLTYASFVLGVHLFFYFSIEAFSFVFFFEIMLNTIFSFIASLIIILLLNFIFRPKT